MLIWKRSCHLNWRAARLLLLAQWTEELPYVADQQGGRILGGVVTAGVVHVPRDDVLMVALGEGPDGLEVVGEIGQSEWHRGWFGWYVLGVGIFVVTTPHA